MLDRNLGNGLLHYISVAAATAGDNTLVTWALQNSNLSVPAGLFLGIYLFHAPQSAEGVRWQDPLSQIEPCWILHVKVADTRTNHTAGFCLVHATPGRAHTARMYILIIFVSVFLIGYMYAAYTARM